MNLEEECFPADEVGLMPSVNPADLKAVWNLWREMQERRPGPTPPANFFPTVGERLMLAVFEEFDKRSGGGTARRAKLLYHAAQALATLRGTDLVAALPRGPVVEKVSVVNARIEWRAIHQTPRDSNLVAETIAIPSTVTRYESRMRVRCGRCGESPRTRATLGC